MMKKLLYLLLMLFSINSSAEIFEATGYGETSESARKNAVMNAVKMSVGEFVLNKQELNNEEFTEKTINYSNAYVKSSRVISEEIVNGEYKVKVEVDIESQKLLEVLKESQTAKISINKNRLKNKISEAEKNSAHNEPHHFEQLVNELLIQPIKEKKHFPEVKIISEIEPIGTKNLEGEIPFEFEIEITPSQAYRNNLKRIVKEIQEDKPNSATRELEQRDLYLDKAHKKDGVENIQVIYLNRDKLDIVLKAYSKNDIGYYSNNPYPKKLNVEFIGRDGQVLKALEQFDFPNIIRRYGIMSFVNHLVSEMSLNFVQYVYGSLKMNIRFVLTEDEVDELQDIKVFFS